MLVININIKNHNYIIINNNDAYFFYDHPDYGILLISNKCPHRGGPLHLANRSCHFLICKWHGLKISNQKILQMALPIIISGENVIAVLNYPSNTNISLLKKQILANQPNSSQEK